MSGRRALAGAVALAVVLATAPGAAAKTLGQVAPADTPSGAECGSCHGFQTSTAPSSPSYAVSAGKWRITSWRTRNTTGKAVATRLWVFRPTKPGAYKLIGRSDKETVGANKAPTHRTSLKVKKGDLIGLEAFGHMVTFYGSGQADDTTAAPECDVTKGQVVGSGTSCKNYTANGLANVSANLKKR